MWILPLTLGGQGRAGGDGLVTAPALPATAATSFKVAAHIRRVAAAAASTAARGAAALGSIAINALR
jgi:hypothetical protein